MTRLACSLIFAFALSCTIPPADPLPEPAVIHAFTASAGAVDAGGTVSLSWVVSNAASLTLQEVSRGESIALPVATPPDAGEADGGDSADGGDEDGGVTDGGEGEPEDAGAVLQGSVEVTVLANSTYVLTAFNERHAPTTAVASVAVDTPPTEFFFAALPSTVSSGEATTLAWNAPGASTVTLHAQPGGAVATGGQTAAGQVVVTPDVPTVYTLSAHGTARALPVKVLPVIEDFIVWELPAPGPPGTVHVLLSWKTRGAAGLSLTHAGTTLLTVTEAGRAKEGSFDTFVPEGDISSLLVFELAVHNASGVATTSTSL